MRRVGGGSSRKCCLVMQSAKIASEMFLVVLSSVGNLTPRKRDRFLCRVEGFPYIDLLSVFLK